MDTDVVTLRNDLSEKLRMVDRRRADDEERGLGTVTLEHLQHLRSPRGIRAVVERQRDRALQHAGRLDRAMSIIDDRHGTCLLYTSRCV